MSRLPLWVTGLAAVTAVACSAPDRVNLPATMAVSPDFSAEQTEAIFAAADAWREATGGVANLKPEIGNSDDAIRVRSIDSHGVELAGTNVIDDQNADIHVDLAGVADNAKQIHVSERLELQDTVMHELGHAFGLDHVPGGLMDPDHYNGCVIDADTLRRFCANYGCPR